MWLGLDLDMASVYNFDSSGYVQEVIFSNFGKLIALLVVIKKVKLLYCSFTVYEVESYFLLLIWPNQVHVQDLVICLSALGPRCGRSLEFMSAWCHNIRCSILCSTLLLR